MAHAKELVDDSVGRISLECTHLGKKQYKTYRAQRLSDIQKGKRLGFGRDQVQADTLAENFKTIDAEVYELEEDVRAECARFPGHSEDVPKKKSRVRIKRQKKTTKTMQQ